MSNIVSAGGIVTKIKNNQINICLISLDPLLNKFVFPKGHIENNETLEQAALREVKEEIGLDNLKIRRYLGMLTRQSIERTGKKVIKDIHIFLMETNNYIHQKSDEKYQWFSFDEAQKVLLDEEKIFLIKNKAEIFKT